jgi:hypothetical protein
MYFQTLIKSLDCSQDDREALFTLCLFHSLIKNQGKIILYVILYVYVCNVEIVHQIISQEMCV